MKMSEEISTKKGEKWIEIPKQLRNDENRFVLLYKIPDEASEKDRLKRKRPSYNNWQNYEKGYRYNDKTLMDHIKGGGGYGILTGFGLVVIDADDPELVGYIRKNLPATFEVKSGRDEGGVHFYFQSDMQDKLLLEMKNTRHYGEVQARGQQVVCPGSPHTNNKIYHVIANRPIANLDEAETRSRLNPFYDESGGRKTKGKGYEDDPECLGMTPVQL